jgi:lysophospholipase L1-like esterase
VRSFEQYIALGDSMSIDLYPALDAGEADVAVALEWDSRAGNVAPLGAASLLHANVDDRYPEFAGHDLTTRCPGIDFVNVAEDGATIGDVFGTQLPQVPESDVPTLLTLSIGGNDLLSAFSNLPKPELLTHIVRDIGDGYEFLVESLHRSRPNATVVLTTIYDPSDDTRRIPGVYDDAGPLPLESLRDMNNRIRAIAGETPRTVLADVHRAFLGHGVTAPESDRWYWKRSWVEPNALGASEIRRLWLDAILTIAED